MKLGLQSLALLLSACVSSSVVAQGSTAASSAALSQSTLPVGSCTADIPCSNGACCNSKSGYCGFGDSFCKTVAAGGPCTSNCDAKAQCGPNAPAGEEECPLKVCCSEVRTTWVLSYCPSKNFFVVVRILWNHRGFLWNGMPEQL
ncbi:hypothetical protein DFH06DRAFT_111254 [Mycena polygramma]|nr:hypothetical protein DFH06DRAFT_111254 [Mycena polygramma]